MYPTLSEALRGWAATRPQAPAWIGRERTLDFTTAAVAVEVLAALLEPWRERGVALALDNGPAWAVCDLAAWTAAVPLVPLPPFFSAAQTAHVLDDSGVGAVLTDQPQAFSNKGEARPLGEVAGVRLWQVMLEPSAPPLPAGIAKVTYTSGTTGAPKGVLLRREAMEAVARSLVWAAGVEAGERHLAVLPLSVLLENIAGLYAPLLAGMGTVLWPVAKLGLRGAAGVDAALLWSALQRAEPDTAVLTPQLLRALVTETERRGPPTARLRFLAVGGGKVPLHLLQRARAAGLPVYEGYGLSECASVVAVNRPGAERPGSVGRPLPHTEVRLAADGEVLVRGAVCAGYLRQEAPPSLDGFWPTGDVGAFDEDGFLFLTGRKKDIYVTAFGRNVSPEWVEGELTQEEGIVQAAVFGEGRAHNLAVLHTTLPEPALTRAVAAANARLPDYARIAAWVRADAPFTPENGLLTPNGRLRRAHIFAAYAQALERLWSKLEN